MDEPKPVRLTSPDNAWAAGAMLISTGIPILSVAEVYQPVALEAWSHLLADVWQWVLLVAAVVAFSTLPLMKRAEGHGNRMRAVQRVEAVATAVVSLCYLLLWGALVHEYGFGSNPLTQLMVAGLGITAGVRVVQIVRGLGRYRRALRAGRTTHVEAIAQSKET
ncbi:hypothetical protein [uncultured Microbacterium sp.]|uniref:hypothetical protein n=1 Tax=uncultured Microbacterium sp. TaxID=191216 RepID=UPI0025F8C401|nr:hypothetical protein [uncultured Microbacterium sp.]